MSAMDKAWAIKSPDGKILLETLKQCGDDRISKIAAWSMTHTAHSSTELDALGYTCVPVTLREIPPAAPKDGADELLREANRIITAYRIAASSAECNPIANRWLDLVSAYLVRASAEIEPTPEMIDAGAQRLVSWEDGCKWPDSWTPLQVRAARNDAERVWRSMWLARNKDAI